jgi:hypothetical protein
MRALSDEETAVRLTAAHNPSATEAVLLRAVEDEDGGVRWEAVKNSSATRSVLVKALEDDEMMWTAARKLQRVAR